MPRCGNCGGTSGDCSCSVVGGSNVTVSGTGSPTDPYVIVATGPTTSVGTRWFTGVGPPADPYPGAMTGDLYLDTSNGNIYELVGTSSMVPGP